MEAYASGTGIARSAAEHPTLKDKKLTSEQVFELARGGNDAAREILAGAVDTLGQALTAVVNAVSPDALIFSGGMCTQQELLVKPLIQYIRSRAYGLAADEKLKIGVSSLSSDAPMIGAAMLDRAL